MTPYRSFLLVVVALVVLAGPVAAQPAEVPPEAAGFDAERLARVDALIQDYVDRGRVAGAVAWVQRDGQPVRRRAYGWHDREAGTPLREDALFRIASMTKAVTTVAVLMLYEEGRFLLGDPVHRFLPAFADAVVAVPPSDSAAGVPFVTVPAERPVTIHDLLTHQAGLTYGSGPAQRAWAEAGATGWYLVGRDETLGAFVDRLASLPLQAQPGQAWQYGYSTDVLGRLVEVVSGMPLDRFFAERIFAPLGMTDTQFFPSPARAARLMPIYGLTEDGALVRTEPEKTADYVEGPRRLFSGGAGLTSTADDYGRFLQMLLQGGVLDGVRLLSPKTVALLHADAAGDAYPWGNLGFGLGFWTVEDLGAYGELGTEGMYGWGSAYYPIYWIDPEERLVALILTQLLPARDVDLARRFQVAVYQAMVE